MDYSTQDYYFQVVSGYVDHLYEDIEESTPAPPHVNNPIESELRETLSIPVPKVTDQNHHRYLNPLELDGLLAAAVSDPVRRYEFSKALHIWQYYHDTDCSEDLKEVLQMVWICYRDLADKYGLSDVMQLDGGSAATITEEPAGSVAAAAEDPRHDVPADWPEMLRTDKAIKLAYALEAAGYLDANWQPGPKLHNRKSEPGEEYRVRAGKIHQGLASYTARQFGNYLKKGRNYIPVLKEFWNTNISRQGAEQKGEHYKEAGSPKAEIDRIVAKLNR